MSKIGDAAHSIEHLDELSRKDNFINRIHPLAKLLLTVLYLVLVVSFRGNQLTGLLGMVLYLFFVFELGGFSLKEALLRLRIVLPLVCIVGIFNPIFDREPVMNLFGLTITNGVLTMLSLMFKGVFTVLASYLLIASTTVEGLCHAMRLLHVPSIIVTEFMLICRYITVLLREAERMTDSYRLRAPGQKGVAFKAWGPMIGQLLLRSMDRAEIVYESMCMRGFDASFPFGAGKKFNKNDAIYMLSLGILMIVLRIFPIFEILGNFFV